MTDESPIRIAVVGSGPAGFYAAGHLLKASEGRFEVDMLERLPTPWGLVRSGVAPDHPKIKSVTRVYEKTAGHPRFRYFGNVTFGVHVSREDLLEHYHAVVYATGSPSDRPLGIPGEDLPGSHAATEFVGWYNGHPDHTDLEFDLVSADRAVVIGNGNVALDVARMLVLSPEELAPTDTANHALEVLARSRVSEVVIVGRRGPAQAAFTNPELLELGELADADVIVEEAELDRALAVADPAGRAGHHVPAQRRDPALLRVAAALQGHDGASSCASCSRPRRSCQTSTAALAPSSSSATSSCPRPEGACARNPPTSARRSRPGSPSARSATVASRSRASPSTSAPRSSPTRAGRVLDPDSGAPLPGEYVVGWIKRGPSGVIGTNKKDAQETVDATARRSLAAERRRRAARRSAARRTSPADRTPPSSRRSCAPASPSSSPTPAGRRSTATSERSASPPAARASSSRAIEELLRVAAAEEP